MLNHPVYNDDGIVNLTFRIYVDVFHLYLISTLLIQHNEEKNKINKEHTKYHSLGHHTLTEEGD